jgi:hypothetical protein
VLLSGVAAARADSVHGCAEATYGIAQIGQVGVQVNFSEDAGCLPAGDSFSNVAVRWGDGTNSPASVTQTASQPFSNLHVTAQHTYASPGDFQISVEATDQQTGEVFVRGQHTTAEIGPQAGNPPKPPGQPPLAPLQPAPGGGSAVKARDRARHFTLHGTTLRAGVVALVWSSSPPALLRARIAWGDGTSAKGKVVGSDGLLRVLGRHRWARPGRYAIAVSVTDASGRVLCTSVGRARVRPAG